MYISYLCRSSHTLRFKFSLSYETFHKPNGPKVTDTQTKCGRQRKGKGKEDVVRQRTKIEKERLRRDDRAFILKWFRDVTNQAVVLGIH